MIRYSLGIDVGSVGSKAVIFDGNRTVASAILPSGTNYQVTATKLKADVLASAGLRAEGISASVATGTGGANAGANGYHSVIICDARGVNFTFPQARTVIDIGGQASRVITIDEKGKVINFSASEICATGSARLLQVLARILQVNIEELGPLSLKATRPSVFSTSCTVFLETEIITRISQGDRPGDIAAGIHRSVAEKVAAMAAGAAIEPEVAIIGGGALDTGLVHAIEDRLRVKALIPENPRIVAALGAAIIAGERQAPF